MEKLIFIPNKPEKKLNGIAIREEDIDMDFLDSINNSQLNESTAGKIHIKQLDEFSGKAIYLTDKCDYVIGLDKEGSTLLIALKKKQNV